MRDLEQHLSASKPRISRRASLDSASILSGARSVPAPSMKSPSSVASKQGRRSSLGFSSGSNNHQATQQRQPSIKKQTRRASLGQMLGNAQKFFSKDDAATVDSDSSCNVSAAFELEQCHESTSKGNNNSRNNKSTTNTLKDLLDEVEELIQQHTQRKVEMEVMLESDLELAKARLASGNQLGAILSMRRVHKNTTLVAYAAAARYQLTQIQNQLYSEQQQQQQQQSGPVSTLQVQEHRRAIREITTKLLKADAPIPTDAFLLNQLESQMEEIGV